MSAHTPGPWSLEPLSLNGTHNFGIRVRGENVAGYAAFINTRWPHVAQQEEQCANARLMVAAPELLDALVQAEKVIDILWVSHHANRADAALEEIRAAIAKATGSQQ